jgi:hypothetical protein
VSTELPWWHSSELTVGVVVDEVKALLIIQSSEVGLGDSETDSARDTLAEGTGSEFDT